MIQLDFIIELKKKYLIYRTATPYYYIRQTMSRATSESQKPIESK